MAKRPWTRELQLRYPPPSDHYILIPDVLHR